MGNKPRIRFKGFTEDWEQRKLSELATINARIGWQNLRTSEFLDSGDYLLITGTDFDNGRIKYGTCHYVEKKRFDQDTKIQLSTGSILITKDGTLGKVALVEELPKPATLNAGVFNVRVKDDAVLSYKYLYHYLKAPFLMKYVTANATGGTIKHLNQSILVDFPIPITEKLEQDRIAKLLDSLELSITLHQCKLEKLKLTKKALLQKLFPKNGKHIPEIRFKGFTDAWEQRKLGEIGKWYKGIGGTKDDLNTKQSGRMFVHYADLYQTSEFLSNVVHWTINEIIGALIAPNSILFPMSDVTPYGLARTTSCKLKDVRAGGDVLINTIDTNIDSDFVSIYINLFSKNILPFVTGTTVKHINSKSLSELTILIPSFEEQVKIVNLVKFYNEIITLHQRKLERLQEVKKGLLQKMFV